MSRRTTLKGLPVDKRTMIFRAVEGILRDDPVLAKVVKTWRSYEGDPDDLAPPTPDQCPWVRLHLEKRPIRHVSESAVAVEVATVIEVAVAGTNQDHLVDLWGAIELPLSVVSSYRGVSVRDYLRHKAVVGPDGGPLPSQGAYEFRFEEPAIFPARNIREGPVDRVDYSEVWGLAGVGKFLCVTRKPA